MSFILFHQKLFEGLPSKYMYLLQVVANNEVKGYIFVIDQTVQSRNPSL